MTASVPWARWRLRIELMVWRHGWLAPGLLVLGSVLLAHGLWSWHHARGQWALLRAAAASAASAASATGTAPGQTTAPPSPTAAEPHERLPATVTPTQAVAELLRVSHRAGLSWPQASHRADTDARGEPLRWRVTQTTPSAYPVLRQAVLATLAALPHVSLDRVSARRDAEGRDSLDLTLEWSIWTRSPTHSTAALPSGPGWGLRERAVPSPEAVPRDLFARPSPPAPVEPAPPAVAVTVEAPPPPTLKVLGKQWDGERWLVFATEGEHTLLLGEGDQLSDGHRVERIEPPTLLLRRDGADTAQPIDIGEIR